MTDLVLALLSGLVGGLVIASLPRVSDGLRNLLALIFAAFATLCTWRVASLVLSGETLHLSGKMAGLTLSLRPDALGAVFGVIVATLWLFATIYSFGYMAGDPRQRTYYSFFLLSLTTTLGIAFSGNLLTAYLFYELLTFATYPLVIHERTEEATKAGAKYIIYSLSGAGAILVAMVVTYNWAGTLDFTAVPLLANVGVRPGTGWLLALFVAGFGVKAAIMPLHGWLPSAMVAPTPVSALLHAVAVVNSGVFGVLRVIYSVFGHELVAQVSFGHILPWIASFTIIMGCVIALKQDVLKRRLAYSTISQLSYILLGAFTLHPLGLTGAIVHMVSHSLLKITLFFSAGIIAKETGKVNISELRGVGWRLPWTLTAFAVASIGMIGMLPLNAFWSKYYLMKGGVAGGKWPLALVLITSGILNAFYFVPIIVTAFQDKPQEALGRGGQGGKSGRQGKRGKHSGQKARSRSSVGYMLAPTLVLVVTSLVMGLLPGLIWPGVETVVNSFF